MAALSVGDASCAGASPFTGWMVIWRDVELVGRFAARALVTAALAASAVRCSNAASNPAPVSVGQAGSQGQAGGTNAVSGGQSNGSAGDGASGGLGGQNTSVGGSSVIDAGAGAPGAGGAGDSSGTGGATGGAGTAGAGGTGAVSGATTSAGAIFSGVPLLDTAGNAVNAHGVGFIHVDKTYYMIGEQRSGKNDSYTGAAINTEDMFTGVNMYSTTDLVSWTFVGTVVKPISGTILGPPYYGERPKILYNTSTSKYVIYIKMLNYINNDYVGYYSVLTSSDIAGPYSYKGNLSLSGASDFEVFQDNDGAQYLVQSGGKLYKLSSDGLSIASTVKTGIQSGEGTSLYRAGSTYFWQSSQGTYWYSNDNSYSTSTALAGAWTSHGLFCPSGTKTWQSQDTAVLPIQGSAGTTYVYVGDRWVNGDLPASTLVFQPLTVNGSTESIPTYYPAWNLDVSAGTWSPATLTGVSVNDSVTGTGQNQFNYDSNWSTGSCAACSGSDSHSSGTTGATASFAFTGSQVLLYSAYSANAGIMGVTIADSSGAPATPELPVSLRYDAAATGNYLVYASPVLPSGSHVLKVRVTGLKDKYSSSAVCNIDRVQVRP